MNHDLMTTLTADHDGDRWGWALGHHFDIAEVMYGLGSEIPDAWDYQPSPALRESRGTDDYAEHVGNDWIFDELTTGLSEGLWSTDDLRHAGNVLHRYCRVLRIAGLDY